MKPYYEDDTISLFHGDAFAVATKLAPKSVRTIVTSPPYFGLRDYGMDGQLGAESTVGEYVSNLVGLFAVLREVLADDGTLWLNLGDSYASEPGWGRGGGSTLGGAKNSAPGRRGKSLKQFDSLTRPRSELPPKNLIGIPWRVAFALQQDGWILRSDIIWSKPVVMPESVTDRPTKAHEYIFLLSKSRRYFYDAEAIREPDVGADHPRSVLFGQPSLEPSGGLNSPHSGLRKFAGRTGEGRNKRSVWTVQTQPFPEAHFAAYPPELIRPCVLAGSGPGDTVLDPFSGSGTTGLVATQEGRKYIGIDLNSDYLDLSLRTRFAQPSLNLGVVS